MIVFSFLYCLAIFCDDFEMMRNQARVDFNNIVLKISSINSCILKDDIISTFFKKYGEENIYSMKLSSNTIKRCIRDSKMGFCCDDGTVVIEPIYDYVTSFYEGYALVRIEDKWGVINRKGDKVVDVNYSREYVKNMVDNLRERYVENRFVYTYQIKLKKLIFEEGELVKFVAGDRVGFTDKDGNIVIPIKYEAGSGFSEGLSAVRFAGKWGFIDREGNTIIPFKFDEADAFFEGRARVKLNGKWGFINKDGKLVIKNQYDYVFPFNEMRAVIVKDGKYGFVDLEGREVIKPIYDDATVFTNGIATVKKGEKSYYIDRWGNSIEKKK